MRENNFFCSSQAVLALGLLTGFSWSDNGCPLAIEIPKTVEKSYKIHNDKAKDIFFI